MIAVTGILVLYFFNFEWVQENWTGGPGYNTFEDQNGFLYSLNMDYFSGQNLKIGDWGWQYVNFINILKFVKNMKYIKGNLYIIGKDANNRELVVIRESDWDWYPTIMPRGLLSIGDVVEYDDNIFASFNFDAFSAIYFLTDSITEDNNTVFVWKITQTLHNADKLTSLCNIDDTLLIVAGAENGTGVLYKSHDPFEGFEKLNILDPLMDSINPIDKISYSGLRHELAALTTDNNVYTVQLSGTVLQWVDTKIPDDINSISDILYLDNDIFAVGENTGNYGSVWKYSGVVEHEWNNVFNNSDFEKFLCINYFSFDKSIYISGKPGEQKKPEVFFSINNGENWEQYGEFYDVYQPDIAAIASGSQELFVISSNNMLFQRWGIGQPFIFAQLISSIYDTGESSIYDYVKVDVEGILESQEVTLFVASLEQEDPDIVDWSNIDPLNLSDSDSFDLTEYNGVNTGDRYLQYLILFSNYNGISPSPQFNKIIIGYHSAKGEFFIVAHEPNDEEDSVRINSTIDVEFSKSVDSTTLKEGFKVMSLKNNSEIEGSFEVDSNIVIFTPYLAFDYNDTISVELSTSIRSIEGDTLTDIYSFIFYTESKQTEENSISSVSLNKSKYFYGDTMEVSVQVYAPLSPVVGGMMSIEEISDTFDFITADPPNYTLDGDIFIDSTLGIGSHSLYVEVYLEDGSYLDTTVTVVIEEPSEFDIDANINSFSGFSGDTIWMHFKVMDPMEGERGFREIHYKLFQYGDVCDSLNFLFEGEPEINLSFPIKGVEKGEATMQFDCRSTLGERNTIEIPLTIKEPPNPIANLIVYPNPCKNDELSIRFNVRINGKFSFKILTSDGLEVYTYSEEEVNSGETVILDREVDVSELPSGMYFLIFSYETHDGKMKIYKKRVGIVK